MTRSNARQARRWRIEVTRGSDKGKWTHVFSEAVHVGSAPSNQLILRDPKVSRHHLRVEVVATGLSLRDLGSKNGTFFEGVRVEFLELPLLGAVVNLGDAELTIRPDDETCAHLPTMHDRCGRLVGKCVKMRELFSLIEQVAPTQATVLICGETGTGKELVAEALHTLSPRKDAPFVTVDCAAIPSELLESELYGHVQGAFTGALRSSEGAFRSAQGGTIFLDEIGELELSLQSKLLRVLESRSVKPVGATRSLPLDVRILAATNRALSEEVKAGRFRADLFFRLSVVCIDVPPLRDRREDIAQIVRHFLEGLGAPPFTFEAMRLLESYSWPGNIRQLRNIVERAAVFAGKGALTVSLEDLEAQSSMRSPSALFSLPYKEAKEELVARFTRDYLESLLARHRGNVSAAAREAQIDRNWIVALAHRHGVQVRE